jgi:hypothetical protein
LRFGFDALRAGVLGILQDYACHVGNIKLFDSTVQYSTGMWDSVCSRIYQREKKDDFQAQCSLTNTAAMPIPEPMHMLVTKIRLFVCFAMFRPVAIWRAPAVQGEGTINTLCTTPNTEKAHSCQGDDQWRSHHRSN